MEKLVTFKIDEEEYAKLRKKAYQKQCSIAELIRQSISKFLRQK